MADENKNTPDVAEFEAKMPAQTGNKDLWLFLIKLNARLHSSEDEKRPAPVAEQEAAPAPEEEIAVAEEVVTVAPAESAVQPQPEPKPAEPEVKPAEPEPQPLAQPADKIESIVFKTIGKSRYRQVTFRYFGDADSVSVVSGFTMAKPRALKKRGDHWEVTLGIAPGTYKFLYIVDGKQTLDPYAEEDDGRSVLVVK